MEILRMPRAMENRGITGWPKIVLVGKNEPAPTNGLPFIRATKQDFVLTFRVMVPLLIENHPQFNWEEVFYELTGRKYKPVQIYQDWSDKRDDDGIGSSYWGAGGESEVSLLELAADTGSQVDLNMLLDMKMIPAFFSDIAEAISVNVTNNFAWEDGYNKKLGICSGYMTEAQRKKSLVILDVSSSIPEAVTAGMMTLIQTITEVTHADLIITGSQSHFYANDEVRVMDIHAEHKKAGRSNEGRMFRKILAENDMNYEVVIAFGDSDHPGNWDLGYGSNTPVCEPGTGLDIKKLYSFFVNEYDRYGNSARHIAGYGRWVKEACPGVEVITNTSWTKLFNRSRRY